MSDDRELLRRYAAEKSEEAFAALVRQHLGLVYHTALRHLSGDAHAAEDVAQAVFADLARKAPSLGGHTLLAGWLHTSARFAALQRLRTDRRLKTREMEAQRMNDINREAESPVDWDRLRPLIDEALHALGERDREAVLLHFFEGQDIRQIAIRLELTPQGARSRVERALEKMHLRLMRQGIGSTVTALSVALTTRAIADAPSGLASAVTTAALRTASGGAAVGALTIMQASSMILTVSLAANLALGIVYLRGDMAREIPVPPVAVVASPRSLPSAIARPPGAPLTDPFEIGLRLRADGFSDRTVVSAVKAAATASTPRTAPPVDVEALAARKRRWNPNPRASGEVTAGLFPPVPLPTIAGVQPRIEAVLLELGYDREGQPLQAKTPGLSVEGAIALRKVENDYEALWRNTPRQSGRSGAAYIAYRDLFIRIADEFGADVRATLSSSEAAEYFDPGRSPLSAQRLQEARTGWNLADEPLPALEPTLLNQMKLAALAGGGPERLDFSAPIGLAMARAYRRAQGDEATLRLIRGASVAGLGRIVELIDPVYRRAGLSTAARVDLYLSMVRMFSERMVDGVEVDSGSLLPRMREALTKGAGLTPAQTVEFDATEFGLMLRNGPSPKR